MDVDTTEERAGSGSPTTAVNGQTVSSEHDAHSLGQHPPHGLERWTKTTKRPGRQARDPQNQTVSFQCRDTDEMENYLRDYLRSPTVSAEHATIQFIFPVSSAFMVYAADFKNVKKTSSDKDKQSYLYSKLERTAISIIDALAPMKDQKDQMRRQKAIAKVCVEACEKADGYRYSFHNNWLSREDAACRFSYFCNDSTLNKGRAANEGAGMLGKKKRKPVYDCRGLIAIKFSATKQNLEIEYKHIPLHQTYAERAPPPRRDSKRRKLMEMFEPENLPQERRKRGPESADATASKRARQNQAFGDTTAAPVNISGGQTVESTSEDIQIIRPAIESLNMPTAPDLSEGPSIERSLRLSDHLQEVASEPSTRMHSGTTTPATEKQHQTKPRRPAIPGTMAGSVQNGHLSWTSSSRAQRRAPSRSITTSLLPSATEAAVATPERPERTSIEITELQLLRQRLEQAEERIRRLESEKSVDHTPPQEQQQQQQQRHTPGPPPPPQQSNQTPHKYPPPPPPPTTQIPSTQIRFHHPPQRPFHPIPIASTTPSPGPGSVIPPPSLSSEPTPPTGTTSTTDKRNSAAARKEVASTKFVLYTPGAKKRRGRENTAAGSATVVAATAVAGESLGDG